MILDSRNKASVLNSRRKRDRGIIDAIVANHFKEKCRRKLEIILGLLEKAEVCKAFEPYTFVTLVEKEVVGCDGRLEFYFRSGMIVEYLLKG